ncbi:carbamoyltransferase N-terminal domain-containing protein [Streptomyces sp. NPDC049944]|uniref:carbamoyltransferase N-terminal domain-containing protein n=1 Tax=Streptomyces sp. NPDC049944 TaxID=3155657 RepID=UPI003438BFFE
MEAYCKEHGLIDGVDCLDADRPLREIRDLLGWEGRVEFVDHHLSYAASAYYFSGFDDSAVGEWATTSWGVELTEQVEFRHSLGLLYSAVTGYLGFEVNEGEYKVMGLAPYGEPRFRDEIGSLIHVTEDGTFRLDLDHFDFTEAFTTSLCPPTRESCVPVRQRSI